MDVCIIAPVSHIARAFVLSAPLVAIVVFIASIAANEPRSIALNGIMGCTAVVLTAAYIIQFKTESSIKKASSPHQLEFTHKKLYETLQNIMRPSPINISLLHSSGLILLFTLVIRLEATDQFGGYPANLDFGVKGYGDGDNIAFGVNFASFGHCVQGAIASFLSYPAVTGAIARVCGSQSTESDDRREKSSFLFKRPSVYVLLLCQLISACMTVYPSYSLIKRATRDLEEFSRTSHLNNTAEWVLGYILGVGVGWLMTILVQKRFLRLAGLAGSEDDNDNGELSQVLAVLSISESALEGNIDYGFGKSSEYKAMASSTVYSVISILSTALILLVNITSLMTGLLIGLTWNFAEVAVKDKIDLDITSVFVGVWFGVTAVFTWFASKKWPFRF